MRNPFPVFLSLACVLAAASAQQVTAPSIFAASEGGTTGNVWRAGTNRVQCFYDASNFTSQGINLPVTISAVEYRLAGGIATNLVTYPNVEIYLQNAAVNFAAPSTSFAANRTVAFPTAPNFAGPVSTVAVGGTTPNDFFINIPLSTPFVYDPSSGQDLLMEIVILGAPSPLLGNSISAGFNVAGHLCNSVRSVGSTTAATGSASAFAPVTRFTYAPVAGAGFNTTLGVGCVRGFASVYETFADGASFDLANSALTFLPNGNGYTVVPGGALLPIGSIGTSTPLVLTDDSEVNVPFTVGSFPGWSALQICSNGFISQAAGNGTNAGPAPAAFLNAPATAFWSWHDYDPATVAGTGSVLFEESAAVTTVTWDQVYDFGNSLPNTMQFQFYANGQVVIAYGAMSGAGNGHLVGYSPGGPNVDPGSIDLSAIASVSVDGADTLPLSVAANVRPITGTNWSLTIGDIPAGGVLGVEIFGLSDPNVNDLSFLGLPDCGLRSSLDALNAFLPAGPTHTYGLTIPANPAFVGIDVYTTAAMFVLPAPNSFGAITANGVRGTIGSL